MGAGGGGAAYGRGAIAGSVVIATATAPEPMSSEGSSARTSQMHRTDVKADDLSTFAADVDNASYTIARRKLGEGQLPPPTTCASKSS